jgi:L-aminopeptidase/D-esterase-like protein
MAVEITTAAITAAAMVGRDAMAGVAVMGATLVTDTDGDLVLALAGDPIGLPTRMPMGMGRGGALLTIIIRALILRLAARTLIPILTAATVPRKILDRTVTTTPRQNHRAFPHGRTLLTLPL